MSNAFPELSAWARWQAMQLLDMGASLYEDVAADPALAKDFALASRIAHELDATFARAYTAGANEAVEHVHAAVHGDGGSASESVHAALKRLRDQYPLRG